MDLNGLRLKFVELPLGQTCPCSLQRLRPFVLGNRPGALRPCSPVDQTAASGLRVLGEHGYGVEVLAVIGPNKVRTRCPCKAARWWSPAAGSVA
jgi:hypothetical protein